MTRLYARNPNVTEKRMDDAVFLAHPDTGALYRLNVTGTALWTLLENPVGADDAIEVLAQAFPAQSHEQIAKDVAQVLADFEKNDLLA